MWTLEMLLPHLPLGKNWIHVLGLGGPWGFWMVVFMDEITLMRNYKVGPCLEFLVMFFWHGTISSAKGR